MATPFTLISGPCVVENEKLCMDVAEHMKTICDNLRIDYIFKASYRKANRSSIDSFQGIGDEKALQIIKKVGMEFGIRTTTDIHTDSEAGIAAEYVDILQIPAFLSRQTSLLLAAGSTGKTVNIKKGQFLSPQAMKFAVEKVKSTGNQHVWLTERGTTFGYTDLVVDYRSIPIMQSFGVPVVLDCTHSLQQPNQSSGVTGGLPQMIETIARAGVAVGVDAIFMETHPEPSNALSDGANMIPLSQMKPLLETLSAISTALS